MRIQDAQLTAAKVSNPGFRGKARNSPDISKGISQSGMCKFESSEVSQPVPEAEKLTRTVTERPANGGLLRIGPWSPGSGFLPFQGENAESLRPDTGIFPFSGDGDRRLGFDRHYVAELAVYLAKFSALAGGKLGMLSPHSRTDAAVH